ncbi:DNA-directed RNA polymerase subunit epsilon [Nicoliella lavandulae]|uniref:DNA-directed RNA polymerase subunit epsilon n=1 Tax=Nicoliella lavandulae TaxID=3082954 RepID=A0ABU8SLJ2_9LACO
MIFKVLYQNSIKRTPRRETTESMYVEADTEVEARSKVESIKDYNIEYVEPLEGNHLEYEKKSPDFKITEIK